MCIRDRINRTYTYLQYITLEFPVRTSPTPLERVLYQGLGDMGFWLLKFDPCVYIYCIVIILTLYVDDLLLLYENKQLLIIPKK